MIASKLLAVAALGLVAALPQSDANFSCDSDCQASISATSVDPENCYGDIGIVHRTCYLCVKVGMGTDAVKGVGNVSNSKKWADICLQEVGDEWTNTKRTNEEATKKSASSTSSASSSSSSDSSDEDDTDTDKDSDKDKDKDKDKDADDDEATSTKADSTSETASGTASGTTSASASASTTPVSAALKSFNVGQLAVVGGAVVGAVAFAL